MKNAYVFIIAILTVVICGTTGEADDTRSFKLWECDGDMLHFRMIKLSDAQYSPQGVLQLLFGDDEEEARQFENALKNDTEEVVWTPGTPAYPEILAVKYGIAYVNLIGDPEFYTERSAAGRDLFPETEQDG